MDSPIPLELPENEEDEDPLVDKDEAQMQEKKESQVQPIEDFVVAKKPPHISEFDDKIQKDAEEAKKEEETKAVTIDDD